jgi:site-specific recombinase XerD
MFHSPAEEIASELRDELGDISGEAAVKQLPAVPTKEEVFALLRAPQDERDHLVIRLFYATGVRNAELAHVRVADCSPEECRIFIRLGKEGKDRYVVADAHTFELLAKHLAGKTPDARVFDLEPRELERIVHRYADEIGLIAKYDAMQRSFSPDSLRHAFATHLYDNGMDLFTLKKLMGHQYLDTTEIYVQTSMRKTTEEYKRTHPLGKTHS